MHFDDDDEEEEEEEGGHGLFTTLNPSYGKTELEIWEN
jgi:hypothetical protein